MREREPQFFQEESQEKKEQTPIEAIENLPLFKDDRMNLILTYLGEKPVSTIEISYDNEDPLATEEEFIAKKEQFEKALKECGLEFELSQKEYINEHGFDVKDLNFIISKERAKIAQFEEASSRDDENKIGELLGFPKTACEAFSKGKAKNKLGQVMFDEKKWWKGLPREEKEKFLEEKAWNFVDFKLSQEHWQEELTRARQWQKIIKEKAPKLYEEIVSEKPEFMRTKTEKAEFRKKETEASLKDIREKVEKIQDNLGEPIEEGIKETVVMLNAFDIRTSQSCEGHLEKDKMPVPWVEIYPREPEAEDWTEDEELEKKVTKQSKFLRKKLTNLLTLFYQKRKVPFDIMLGFKEIGYGFRIQSHGGEFFEILDKKEQAEKLKASRKEMKNFTNFLGKNLPKYSYKDLIL